MCIRDRSSIAPFAALIPQLIFIPSNAGPAAQEQHKSLPLFEMCIRDRFKLNTNDTP